MGEREEAGIPRRRLGRSGLMVPALSFGGVGIGGLYGEVAESEGIETVQAIGPLDVGAPEPVAHCVQALELKARGAALAVAGPTDEAGPF